MSISLSSPTYSAATVLQPQHDALGRQVEQREPQNTNDPAQEPVTASVASISATTAPTAPTNLPSASKLKGKIAKFLRKHFDKGYFKAKAIAHRIPTDDPLRLNNIYGNLRCIRRDNGNSYKEFKKTLHWEMGSWENALRFVGGIYTAGISEIIVRPIKYNLESTDQRRTLRSLMLFMLSGIDPTLYDRNRENYAKVIKWADAVCYNYIRRVDIQELMRHVNNDDPDCYPIPIIINELRGLIDVD